MLENKTTVFVVDDDCSVRNSVRRLLTAAGMQVVTNRSAQEFLDVLNPGTPGCVILDVRMPGMGGPELQCHLADSDDPLPVIVVTGHASVALTAKAMRRGAVSVLEKPYDPNVLIELTREAIEIDAKVRKARAVKREHEKRVDRLTPREHQVLDLVVDGYTSNRIANRLGLSPKTIHAHRSEVMEKMGAGSVAELVRDTVIARLVHDWGRVCNSD